MTQFASAEQVVGQLVETPPQRYGEHDGLPTAPAGVVEQVPRLPARLHASHWPVQVVLQHTPSAQTRPATHCPLPSGHGLPDDRATAWR